MNEQDWSLDDQDVEARLRQIDEQVAAAQERAAAAQELASQVETLRQEVTSDGREVTVEVDSAGRILSIKFTDSALRLTARELSEVVMETVNAARNKAGKIVLDMAREAFGAESDSWEQMRRAFGPVDDAKPKSASSGSSGDGFFTT